jgi:ankyrin repeat protein
VAAAAGHRHVAALRRAATAALAQHAQGEGLSCAEAAERRLLMLRWLLRPGAGQLSPLMLAAARRRGRALALVLRWTSDWCGCGLCVRFNGDACTSVPRERVEEAASAASRCLLAALLQQPDAAGRTALHYAAATGDAAVFSLLLSPSSRLGLGREARRVDHGGVTVAMCAAVGGNEVLLQVLEQLETEE